uniref:Rab_A72 protein n=1 Tax=Paramecium tetraurelia TaxID=5888 RepID=Q3SDU1_PARTE|nr:rab_A72 [Paramecium tetraurelia]
MNFEDYQYLFKFVLIGDTGCIHQLFLGVGKSCFLSQYVKGKFIQEYDPTIGLEFESKSIEFNDGVVVQNQLWDTVTFTILISLEALNLWQYRKHFVKSNQSSLYTQSSAAAAIVFYKINSEASFKSLQNWINILKQVSSDKIQIVIVATNKDLEDQRYTIISQFRQVQTSQGRDLADSLEAKFYEISNHDKDQIDGIVNSISYNVLRLINSSKINPLNTQYGVKMSRQQEQQYASQIENTDEKVIQQSPSPKRRGSDIKTEQNMISPNKISASPQRSQQEQEQTQQNQQQEKPKIQLRHILIPIIVAYVLYLIFF